MKILILSLLVCLNFTDLFGQSSEDLLNGKTASEFNRKRPMVAVVLGGGGARGLSHIGALKVLEERKVPIDLIIGVSMGSIIGGLYAAGYSTSELEEIVLKFDWENLLSEKSERKSLLASQQEEGESYNFSIRFNGLKPYVPLGFSSGQNLTRFLNGLFLQAPYKPDPDFDNMKIPFRAVVADLNTGNPIVFSDGDIVEILRASISIPLIFSPVEKDGMLLTDGGIVNPLPTDIARELGADIIIAFNVASHLRKSGHLELPWQIADQIITIMMQPSLKKLKEQADVLIEPDLNLRLPSDFTNLPDLISQGQAAAEAGYNKIDSLLKNWKQSEKEPDINVQRSANSQQSKFPPSSITINGASEFSEEELLKTLNSADYSEAEEPLLQHLFENIIRQYRKKGYSLAKITDYHFDPLDNSLEINIDEGIINSIVVEGNIFTSKQVILNEFPLSKGDLFNFRKAENGLDNIYSTKLFRQVSLFVDQENDENKVILRVVEQPYLRALLSVRSDRERTTRGKLELRHENLFGLGINTSVSGILGNRDKIGHLRYRAPRFFNTFLTNGIELTYGSRDDYLYADKSIRIGTYNEKRLEASFILGAQVRRLGAATGEVLFISSDITGISDAGFTRESDDDIIAFRFRSTVDRRNSLPVPTAGQYSQITYTFSTSSLGSELGFSSFEAKFESYTTFNKRITFSPSVYFGIADKTMPFSEQFRFGGRTMLYGTRENRFVGRKYFNSSIELRYRMPTKNYFNTHFSIRYDLGQMQQNPDTPFDVDKFVSGYGAAIILETPFGPASIEWGKSSESVERLYITLGYDIN